MYVVKDMEVTFGSNNLLGYFIRCKLYIEYVLGSLAGNYKEKKK